jgi:hypothetical protein
MRWGYPRASILSCVFVAKSLASWRSRNCSAGRPLVRLTIRPRFPDALDLAVLRRAALRRMNRTEDLHVKALEKTIDCTSSMEPDSPRRT